MLAVTILLQPEGSLHGMNKSLLHPHYKPSKTKQKKLTNLCEPFFFSDKNTSFQQSKKITKKRNKINLNLIKESTETLDLSNLTFTTKDLNSALLKLKVLKKLIIKSPSAEGNFNWAEIEWKNARQLEEIEVIDANIPTSTVNEILKRCLNLKTLNLHASKELIEWDQISLKRYAKKLEKIDLSETYCQERYINKILESCTHLKELCLCRAFQKLDNKKRNISLESIQWKNAKKLAKLDISGIRISPEILNLIFSSIQNLTTLKLIYSMTIYWEDVLWEKAQSLKELNLNGTDIENNFIINTILKKIPNCKVVIFE